MSIFSINLETYKQNFDISGNNKKKYGEVHTTFKLIYEIFELIPIKYFKNPHLKWLDPGTGRGYFSMVLYKKLFKNLINAFPNEEKRHKHIINNMIWMVEYNIDFIPLLKSIFGEKSNIYNENYIHFNDFSYKFDFIIGNPPFNVGGKIINTGRSVIKNFKEGAKITFQKS